MEVLKELGEKIIEVLIKEFEQQGHSLNGALEESLEAKPYDRGVEIWGNHYGKYVDEGVTADRIPYSRGSGAGKSKYIKGLTDYVLSRMGIGGAEGLAIAFAIANKHKQEGMPTTDSYKYSKTGRRTGFIDDALMKNDREINDIIGNLFTDYVLKRIR